MLTNEVAKSRKLENNDLDYMLRQLVVTVWGRVWIGRDDAYGCELATNASKHVESTRLRERWARDGRSLYEKILASL